MDPSAMLMEAVDACNVSKVTQLVLCIEELNYDIVQIAHEVAYTKDNIAIQKLMDKAMKDIRSKQREQLQGAERNTINKREQLSAEEREEIDKALWDAAARGDVSTVENKLALGAAPDGYKDVHGRTALLEAAREGHLPVVEKLIAAGSSLQHVSSIGETALYLASFGGYQDIVQLILDDPRGLATINTAATYNGYTALLAAASEGHLPVVEKLIAAGSSLQHVDNDGWTALWLASRWGHQDIVQLILDDPRGRATINQAPTSGPYEGYTALLVAVRYDHLPVVEKLIAAGSSLEHVDEYGQTALWWASYGGHQDIVQHILDDPRGLATINTAPTSGTNKGLTPLGAAKRWNKTAVVAVLEAAGGR